MENRYGTPNIKPSTQNSSRWFSKCTRPNIKPSTQKFRRWFWPAPSGPQNNIITAYIRRHINVYQGSEGAYAGWLPSAAHMCTAGLH